MFLKDDSLTDLETLYSQFETDACVAGSQGFHIIVLSSIDEANDKQHSCIVSIGWLLSPVLYCRKDWILQNLLLFQLLAMCTYRLCCQQ